MPAPISNEQAPLELSAVINEWQRLWHDDGFVAEVEHAAHCDDKGHYHWMIRLRGEEKNVIALWLTLRQRTVFLETQVMPAPEENLEALYKYLLVRTRTCATCIWRSDSRRASTWWDRSPWAK